MNDTSKIMIAALAGAAVGAVAALLFAPATGKETRDKLKDKLSSAKDSIDELLNQGKDIANGAVEKVKAEVKEHGTKAAHANSQANS